MKRTKILYWVFTILFAGFMLFSAVSGVVPGPDAVKLFHDALGYPVYFIPFISIAKILGVIAILVPGFPKLKEWAYAGLVFDLAGATYSMMSAGLADAGGMGFMALGFLLAAASYIFYHKKRKDALVIPSTGF